MLVKFFLTNILRANITLFVMTNLEELIKIDFTRKPFVALWLLSTLGALGRRFESSTPEWLFSDYII